MGVADKFHRLFARYAREPDAAARPLVVPPTGPPATSIDEVIERMQSIDALLSPADGLACFNRMYLEVTQGVKTRVQNDFFSDSGFVSRLDVVFANLYFSAVDSLSGPPSDIPAAWQPLLVDRANPRIEPIQFALAGMNAHINHDLPIAVVTTCTELSSAPGDAPHHADFQKVDALLDAAEQSVRESFEPPDIEAVDHHVAAVANVVCNWTVNAARDVAWHTALGLWEVRDHTEATSLLTGALARTVAMASRGLLVVV